MEAQEARLSDFNLWQKGCKMEGEGFKRQTRCFQGLTHTARNQSL